MEFSIINYYGKQISKCGYCKGLECSVAHGMHAYKMLPQDYQDLIDRGWRRSGHYCYKPHNQSTCCPCYTIKCNVQEFKITKSHKKVLKRMNNFLRYGKKDKVAMDAEIASEGDAEICGSGGDGDVGEGIHDIPQTPQVPLPCIDLDAVAAANPVRPQVVVKKKHSEDCDDEPMRKNSECTVAAQLDNPSTSLASTDQIGSHNLKLPCKKAKQLRLERRRAKLASKGIDASTTVKPTNCAVPEKTLQDYFNAVSPDAKHSLKLKLIHVKSKQFGSTLSATYALYQKYQTSVHEDPPEDVKEYLEFLQRSPLKHMTTSDGPSMGYGSFHQQYWLDDKLIAVAVIDILPFCVSSVYFFYDPDYSFLSLGTYGSLREICLVQELAAKVPTLKYYYMGFYIHSCPKMRYKGKLQPSYLLCPETYKWILLNDELCAKLDQNKYLRLNRDLSERDVDSFFASHLDAVLLLIDNNTCITYREYIQITGENDDRDTILEYGQLVGRSCAHRMLYLKI